MTNSKLTNMERLRTSGEHGLYDKSRWVEDSKKRLTSAKLLRCISQEKKQELKEYLRKNTDQGRHIYNYSHPWEATTQTSFLLLGYAIELLLKSGIVSICIYLPKRILTNQVKRYSHKLVNILQVLHISLEKNEIRLLEELSSFIVQETRYPIASESTLDYCNKVNSINSKLLDDDLFNIGITIYEKIESVICEIDGIKTNPKNMFRMNIDDDGYFTFRCGGSIPSVCIVNFSSYMRENGDDNLSGLKSIVQDVKNCNLDCQLMLNLWDHTDFHEIVLKSENEYFKKIQS